MPPRRNSTAPSAAASMSGRPRNSRARRMIGSWRAASPRGGACNTSARRSSMPAPLAAAAALSALAGVGALGGRRRDGAGARRGCRAGRAEAGLDGAGCASAATVKAASGVASHVAPSRGRSRTLDRGSWRAAGLTGRVAGGCEARGRLSRAGRRTETVPRPAADATPICRIDYPRGVPFLALARPPIRPVTPPSPPAPVIAWTDPARADAFFAWLARVGTQHAVLAASLRPASSDASFRRYFRADREAGGSVIVMDAPPPQEDVRPFVHVAGLISAAGLHAPARPRSGHGARLPPPRRPRQRALSPGAAGCAGERRPGSRRPPDARRDRRPGRLAAQGAGASAAALRRRAAAPRARALSRLVRDARMRRHLERGTTRRPGTRRATSSSPPPWRSRSSPCTATGCRGT